MGKKRHDLSWSLQIAGILLIWLWSPAAGPLYGEETGEAPREQSDLGELRIEGKDIKRLVLDCRDGDRREIDQPAESIILPAGEYMLHEVRLQDGYICNPDQLPDRNWITVGPDKSPVIKTGAPLEQKVKVDRQGNFLVLRYELVGTGQEQYRRRPRGSDKPPQFTVYKGDKRIGGGSFEYG